MGDFPYLELLSRQYLQKAKDSLERKGRREPESGETQEKDGCWVKIIQVHGLANACVARDPTDARWEQVYEIEKLWYNGNHPAGTFHEHQNLIKQHKQQLRDFRVRTKNNFECLKPEHEALDIDDIFSDANLSRARAFADKVFSASKQCSDELVLLSQCVIESSVKLLKDAGVTAPCSFAVIGLGSISRGEATPYSDLEYAFIVEDHINDEYFMKLAIDTYFRIGNFGETPVWSFWVDELKDQSQFVDELEVVGYRFDGITENSGNIPTGNGLKKGKSLILTASELMGLYRKELAAPPGPLVGDLPHLLSSSVLVYSHNGGKQFYNAFLKKRRDFELQEAVGDEHVCQKRLDALRKDAMAYKFLPELSLSPTFKSGEIAVKPDIFRYPTLLATNLKICLALDECFPWEIYSKIHESLGMLSLEDYDYICIVLALSIYIRTSAYLSRGTQSNRLSIYTCATDFPRRDRYYVARNVFVTLGCLLVPIKNAVRSKMAELSSIDVVNLEKKDILGDFHVSKTDFMLKAEVLFFVGEVFMGLNEIYKLISESVVKEGCDKFVEAVGKIYGHPESHPAINTHVEVCAVLLFFTNNFCHVLSYLKWMEFHTSGFDATRFLISKAQCHNNLDEYDAAMLVLKDVSVFVKKELSVDVSQSLPSFALERLRSDEVLSSRDVKLFKIVAFVTATQGLSYYGLKLFDKAEESLSVSAMLCHLLLRKGMDMQLRSIDILNNLGTLYHETGNIGKALNIYSTILYRLKRIHGEATNHPSVANGYNNIGRVYSDIGEYKKAISYHTKSLDMKLALYGENFNHTDIASSYQNLGNMHSSGLGNYEKGLTYHGKCLSMLNALYGVEKGHPDIADCYNNLGNVYSLMGRYDDSLINHEKSLHMKLSLYGNEKGHSGIASSYNNIGTIYYQLAKYSDALKYFLSAVKIFKEVHGEKMNHPDIATGFSNIGMMYMHLGDNSKALEYQTDSLNMKRALYGSHKHPDLAASYMNTGILYSDMGQHEKSLECYQASLIIFQAAYGKDGAHPYIAGTYLNIGNACIHLGKLAESLEWFFKSLRTNKAIHHNTPHNDIALCYNSIASAYGEMGVFDKSLEYNKESIAMVKELHGDESNHADLEYGYTVTGVVHIEMGQYAKSLEYFTKAMEINGFRYGEDANHPSTSRLHFLCGNAYSCLGDICIAFSHTETSLIMRKQNHNDDPNHLDVIETYLSLGRLYYQCGMFVEAFHCHGEALVSAGREKRNQTLLSVALLEIAEIWLYVDECRWALGFLHIAFRKASNLKQRAKICYLAGKCHLKMQSWRKAWLFLYLALCGYQSQPQSADVQCSLVKTRLAVSHLLLCVGHVCQAMEQADLALSVTRGLIADGKEIVPEYQQLNEAALLLTGSLELLKFGIKLSN